MIAMPLSAKSHLVESHPLENSAILKGHPVDTSARLSYSSKSCSLESLARLKIIL